MSETLAAVTRWAAAAPETVCVREADGEVSRYGQLLEEAVRMSGRLQEAGVSAGDLVAIVSRRRAPAIAAMLATWLLGAAYLPLSDTQPQGRRRKLLDLAAPRVVLHEPVDQSGGLTCLVRESPASKIPPDTAYVIFTSGSTGVPKGVMIRHSSLAMLTEEFKEITDLAQGEVVSQAMDLGFDASVLEIWGSLANGASLAVMDRSDLLDPFQVQDFLLRREVSVGIVPAALVAGLLDLPWPEQVPLRVVVTGGDRLSRWPSARHPFRLDNHYGPTECTVSATYHSLLPDGGPGAPPIGRPLPYVRTRVVGQDDEIVATGDVGELWLGGKALCTGYMNDTNSDAFVVRDGRRWYRTGDLVRQDDDGVLHFVCRKDDQLQIGGRRTEPAEITAVLQSFPAAAAAVVFTVSPPSGAVRLAAAVTPASLDEGALWSHIQSSLPDYMVPRDLLRLDAIPTTDNGKYDLNALRSALVNSPEIAGDTVSQDPTERQLAHAWSKVCGVHPRSADDTLIALGAGSLDLVALRAYLRTQAAPTATTALSLQQSLREQAAVLSDQGAFHPPMVEGALEGPASYNQEAIVFLEKAAGTSLGYQYQMALEGQGNPETAVLAQALQAVLDGQPALRVRWRLDRSGVTAERCAQTPVELVQRNVDEDELRAAEAAFGRAPVRRADHPLISWELLRHGSGTTLLQREHHLVHDGWSVGVFLRQLQDAYDHLASGRSWTPPGTGMTYFDWSLRQRAWVDSEQSDGDRRYWRQVLAGKSDRPFAPPWGEHSAATGGRQSAMVVCSLGLARSRAGLATATRLGVTPFALFLSVFRRLLAELDHAAGETTIGSGFANREPGTEHVVGMFVNVLPLRRPFLASETPADAVREEMRVLTEASLHERLPTSEIVRMTCRGHSLRHNPLYQVLFSHHDAAMPRLRLGSWYPRIRELANGHGKLDLNVILMNRDLQHSRDIHGQSRRSVGEYSLNWQYNTTVYPDRTIAAMHQRYLDLLDHACDLPSHSWPAARNYWGDR